MTEPIDIPLPTPPDLPEEDGSYAVWTPDQQYFVMSAAAKAEFERYTKEHTLPPDLFLQAILRNDLIEAVHLAPQEVVRHIPAFVFFLMHNAPGNSWGSQEAVEQWVKGKQEPADDGFTVIQEPEVGGHA